MATLILNSNAAERSGSFVQISFSALGGGPAPFETRTVEIKTADEAVAAFWGYVKDAKATGAGMHCSARLKAGDRAPRGFKALRLEANVNV